VLLFSAMLGKGLIALLMRRGKGIGQKTEDNAEKFLCEMSLLAGLTRGWTRRGGEGTSSDKSLLNRKKPLRVRKDRKKWAYQGRISGQCPRAKRGG